MKFKYWSSVGLFVFLALVTVERDLLGLPWKGHVFMFTTSELAVLGFVASVVALASERLKAFVKARWELWACLLSFVLIAAASTWVSPMPFQAARFSLRLIGGFLVFVTWVVFLDRAMTDRLVKVLVVWDICVCLIGIAERLWVHQVWHLLGMVRNAVSEWEPRVASVFNNPNVFGAYSTVIFALVLSAWMLGRLSSRWFVVEAVAEFISIALSGSRNAILVMGGLLLWVLVGYPRWRRVAGGVTVLFVVIVMAYPLSRYRVIYPLVNLGWVPASMAQRVGVDAEKLPSEMALNAALTNRPKVWQAAFQAWKEHPLLGVGPGVFRFIGSRYGDVGGHGEVHTNNLFVEFGVSMGVLGLLWLLGCLGTVWYWGIQAAHRGGSMVMMWPFLVGVSSQAFFDYFLDHSLPFAVVFWLAAAYPVVMGREHRFAESRGRGRDPGLNPFRSKVLEGPPT